MKRILFALSISMFALASTASAETPSGLAQAPHQPQFKGSLKVSAAMQDLGATKLSSPRMVNTRLGRRDMLTTTPVSLHTMVRNVAQAYRKRAPMFSGWEVKGYAYIDARNTWTVTLEKDGVLQIIELSKAPNGTNVRTWGWTKKAPRGHRF